MKPPHWSECTWCGGRKEIDKDGYPYCTSKACQDEQDDRLKEDRTPRNRAERRAATKKARKA